MHILSPKVKSESRLYEPVKNFAPSILPFFEEWIKDLGINKKENDPVKQFKDGLKMS
jgi:membrane protein required for colicin V production